MAKIAYLECVRCGAHVSADKPQTVCPVCVEQGNLPAGSLFVRYDLQPTPREAIDSRAVGMWRYANVALPDAEPVTLGEGWTPMVASRRYPNVLVKDEGANPTGTFKARGMAMAVTMARHYGLKKLAAPSAGNAGSALAAYAARAGMEAHIFMPKDVPFANYVETVAYGAHVTLVDGLISDCGRMVAERKDAEGWFEVSTMKEPFRVEGKKTMGYELVEQLGWEYPDAVFYPTGGGVGLIGIWKAFEEMERLGWVAPGSKRPKMIAVQAAGCAPMVKAFEEGANVSQMWQGAETLAAGLRVPKPYGDAVMLKILRESGGTAVAVSDAEIFASLGEWAREEGMMLCPEGASMMHAYDRLVRERFLAKTDRVVLLNTGTGLKYTDVIGKEQGLRD
ncbi:threonine synthase [Terracidiphilus sp.]|jgi:threonine synthase|uniref:threonine synthase n=1 Tax=Terracidiphilus sp. TaxID=1964191 RepID=UPI003C1A318F